jgi:tRNA(Ile)-lysidine synthase
MHLVRGTGLKGLGGIMPVSGNLIRPMLAVTRDQVIAFLEEYSVGFVEDSSNAADDFLRNRLRHHVIPLLKAENPRITQNLSETAQSLRQDSELLEGLAADTIEDVAALRKMEDAKRVRVLGAYLEKCGVKEPSRKHILLLQELVFSENPSAKGHFPGGVVIAREYGRLVKLEKADALPCLELTCPGQWELPAAGLRVICRPADKILNTPNAFTLWPAGKFVLRSRQAGDTLATAGGTKRLKERFIDRKIPAARRSLVPVVADEQGVLGVYGFGADIRRACPDKQGITVIFEEIENA